MRLKHGMDLQSLQRLNLGIVAPVPPVTLPPTQDASSFVAVPAPAPVPVVESETSEIYDPFAEDFTARSMSLSSDGGRSRRDVKAKVSKGISKLLINAVWVGLKIRVQ